MFLFGWILHFQKTFEDFENLEMGGKIYAYFEYKKIYVDASVEIQYKDEDDIDKNVTDIKVVSTNSLQFLYIMLLNFVNLASYRLLILSFIFLDLFWFHPWRATNIYWWCFKSVQRYFKKFWVKRNKVPWIKSNVYAVISFKHGNLMISAFNIYKFF